MYTRIFGHKHGHKHTTLIALTAFTFVTVMPANALAFEAGLSISPMPRFTAMVQLAGRDPYLAQAIDNLPSYRYTSAGSVVSSPSPMTTVGIWPVKRTWTPVAPFPVVATPTPSPVINPSPAPTTTDRNSLLVMEGEASYYSRAGCLGCDPRFIMANGQPLNDNALTMAIGADKKHFVGRTARVTSLATGKSVEVRITDTGGFYQAKYGHRVADLTVATKQAIGMAGGVGQVRVEVF
ncbi:MAG: septal ring lytic transglycosylase RlpA family protein [Candidatus Andersenbacteria bacterium]